MDPNYIILLQTASVIGNEFNLASLMAVMPIDINQHDVKCYMADLCEIEYLSQYNVEEWAFNSEWARVIF
jgi:hypothetical protein